jgi:tyrosine-protein phosphatase YwqE
MKLLNLFKRTTPESLQDLSKLITDVHSHLIPGIDDGSQSLDETLGMLLKFSELGYQRVITTPHVMSDQYRNTPEIILRGLEEVRAAVTEAGIPIQVDAAAEYYLDEFLTEKVEREEILTFGDNYLLFELSFTTPPNLLDNFIFSAKTRGYNPVIAHFERYPYYFSNPQEKLSDLRNKGVMIQLNALSLTGHYGPHIRKQAEWMVDHDFVDLVGTDAHRIQHLQLLNKLFSNKYFIKLMERDLLNKTLLT